MGYSCTAKAALVRDAIQVLVDDAFYPSKKGPSNRTIDGGFWETGRERADGAITGTVWRKLNAAEKIKYASLDNLDARVTRRGSFKIDPEGKIVRFPGLPRDLKAAAEARGAKRYDELYVNPKPVFNEKLGAYTV
jgi:hypothetical protein